jgi:hypothetical protein
VCSRLNFVNARGLNVANSPAFYTRNVTQIANKGGVEIKRHLVKLAPTTLGKKIDEKKHDDGEKTVVELFSLSF